MASVRFEWDSAKDKENQHKHGVPFEVAQYAFADPGRRLAGWRPSGSRGRASGTSPGRPGVSRGAPGTIQCRHGGAEAGWRNRFDARTLATIGPELPR